MTLAKSSAPKTANETQPEQRTQLPAVVRLTRKGGQGVGQDQATAFGQEADSAATVARLSLAADQTADAASPESTLASEQEPSTQPDASILTWQALNAGPAVDLSAGMESFTTLAQAPASVLSDLPAKQAQSMAASAPGLSLPMAGLLAVGAVIAGVAGGSSSDNSAESATKALDDKLDAIKLALKVDSGPDSKDGVTSTSTLELKDASGTVLVTDPAGLQYSKDGGKTWVSDLSKFVPDSGANSVILRFQGDKDLVSKSSTPLTFTFDNVAPTTPTVGLKSDSGASATDKITKAVASAADLTTSVLEAGARVEVSAKADGVFSSTFTPAEGSNTVQIRAVDLAGNVSGSSPSFTFTFDSKAAEVPKIGIVGDKLNDTGASATDGLTKLTNPVLAGTAEPNSKLSIELANGATAVKVDTSVDAAGKWEVPLPAGTVLADGIPQATVSITDLAGNTASSKAAATFTIDTKAPLASQITAKLDKTSDDGVSPTDGITSSQSPLLSGTAEAGSTVAVSFAGVTGSTLAVVGADGKWSAQVQLSPGKWTPVVKATDAAGNVSEPAPGTAFEIKPDITAELKHDAANDTGISASDSLTFNTFPTLVGYSLPNASVKIGLLELPNQAFDITKTGADGTWSVNVKSLLADGVYTPTIATLGVAGVSETPINGTKFTVDTKAPDVADVTVALDAASDTGVSKVDGLTSITTPTISGEAAPGSLVSVSLKGGLDGATKVSVKDAILVGADGKWSSAIKLTAGVWTPSVTVSDAAGNPSDSKDGDSFEIVTQAASSTISLDPGSETGNSMEGSLEDGVISIARLTLDGGVLTLTGTVDAMREGTTVVVTLGSVSDEVEPDSDGLWTYTPAKSLADGEYSAKVVVKDVVGFDPVATVQKIVIDSTAPKLLHPADLVQTAGVAFKIDPSYGKFATGDEVLYEDVGVTAIGFDFNPDTGAVSAPTKWELTEDSTTFGWVRTTVTDLAGNASVDEYQVAAVTKTTNYTTSSAQKINETSFAPTLYVDKTTDPGLTVTLTATVGSVIQMGAGNDTVKLDGADFFEMKFAALDGGAGTDDTLSLNADTAGGLFIDLSTFNLAGFGDGQVLTNFESLKFSTAADNAGFLSLSPEDLYRLSSDLIDTVGGSWSTLVVSGNADDTVSLVSIDLSPDDGVDQDFYQVGDAGKFTATGAAGSGYTKVRATVTDADGSHGVELLIASAVTLDPGSIDLQRAYPVIGA